MIPWIQNFGTQVPTVSTKNPHSVKEVRGGPDRGDPGFPSFYLFAGDQEQKLGERMGNILYGQDL